MDTAIIVALIAAVAGLLTSAWTVRRQNQAARELAELQHQREQEMQAHEREIAAKEQLDRYREPLLAAAQSLLDRIRNVRASYFLAYLQLPDDRRRRLALLGTLYRMGRYWTTVEGLYDEVNILRFQTEAETKRVAELLDQIADAFASDTLDESRLMVWREEQRAIAEAMRPDGNNGRAAIGFASFVRDYNDRYAEWFADLERDLRCEGIEQSDRLQVVQDLLAQLVDQLEAGRTYQA